MGTILPLRRNDDFEVILKEDFEKGRIWKGHTLCS